MSGKTKTKTWKETKKLIIRKKTDRGNESSTYIRFYLGIVIMNENLKTRKLFQESQTGIYTALYKKATFKL